MLDILYFQEVAKWLPRDKCSVACEVNLGVLLVLYVVLSQPDPHTHTQSLI